MVSQKKFSKTIESDSELILNSDYYLHKAIMQAIESPFKGLENNTFNEALNAIRISSFLAEKLAMSSGIIKDEAKKELADYLERDKKNILSEYGVNPNEDAGKTLLAYSKIAWILSKVEETKPTNTEYHV